MLSRSGIYAVRALIALAERDDDSYVGAGALAEEIGSPRNYLGKILQLLTKQGILESQKGLGGGFRLARDPSRISLLDIVGPIEDVDRWNGCILGRDRCSGKDPCPVHTRWKVIRDSYLELLKNTAVSDVADTE